MQVSYKSGGLIKNKENDLPAFIKVIGQITFAFLKNLMPITPLCKAANYSITKRFSLRSKITVNGIELVAGGYNNLPQAS